MAMATDIRIMTMRTPTRPAIGSVDGDLMVPTEYEFATATEPDRDYCCGSERVPQDMATAVDPGLHAPVGVLVCPFVQICECPPWHRQGLWGQRYRDGLQAVGVYSNAIKINPPTAIV